MPKKRRPMRRLLAALSAALLAGALTLPALADDSSPLGPALSAAVEAAGRSRSSDTEDASTAALPPDPAPDWSGGTALSTASSWILTPYDGGFFTIQLPAGWMIQTMGQYGDFAFRSWDPADPDYEIFYYGSLSPFMKSEEARAWNRQAAALAGGLSVYGVFADAPVIDPYDVASLFPVWNEYAAVIRAYEGTFTNYMSFPPLNDLSVQEKLPVSTYFAGAASDEGIVLVDFRSAMGTACTGKIFATLLPGTPIYADGIDQSFAEALCVTGVLAPRDSFYDVEAILTQAVYSLQFSDQYVREAQTYAEQSAASAMADNAALQAIYDRCNAAWSAYLRG